MPLECLSANAALPLPLKPEPCGNGSRVQVNSALRGSREVKRATADTLQASWSALFYFYFKSFYFKVKKNPSISPKRRLCCTALTWQQRAAGAFCRRYS